MSDDTPEGFRQRAYRLWNETGLRNIKPHSLRYGEFPEGWDVPTALRRIVGPFIGQDIMEFGCGYGRLCRGFDSKQYIGVDINAEAIARARMENPGYYFEHVPYGGPYPEADTVMAYAVLLHLSDDEVRLALGQFARTAQTIVIADVMQPEQTFDTNQSTNYDDPSRFHAVFSRSPSFYVDAMRPLGFVLVERVARPYHYYAKQKGEQTFLIFGRANDAPARLRLPEDFANPYLQYAGLYDDGWTEAVFSVEMTAPEQARELMIRGLWPARSGPQEMIVHLGETVRKAVIEPGEFMLAVPLPRRGRLPVRLEVGSLLALAPPDTRKVGFLLRSLDFT